MAQNRYNAVINIGLASIVHLVRAQKAVKKRYQTYFPSQYIKQNVFLNSF